MKISSRLARGIASFALVIAGALAGQACIVPANLRQPMIVGNYGGYGYQMDPFTGGSYFAGGNYAGQWYPRGYYRQDAPFFVAPGGQVVGPDGVQGSYAQTPQAAQQRAQAHAMGIAPPVPAYANPARPMGFRVGDGAPVYSNDECWRVGCYMQKTRACAISPASAVCVTTPKEHNNPN